MERQGDVSHSLYTTQNREATFIVIDLFMIVSVVSGTPTVEDGYNGVIYNGIRVITK